MEQTYLDMFLQGGIIIIALAILSIISLAIIIERLVNIYRTNARRDNLFTELKSVANSKDEKEKEKILSRIKLSIGKYIARLKPGVSNPNSNKETIEEIVTEVDANLKRRTHVLVFIVQLAPLLGILGTVLGLAEAFLSIGNLGGSEKFQFLSQGIGKALSTTIAGLVIAAYTMIGHYLIKYKNSKSLTTLTKQIEDYVESILVKDEN
ncbi:MAG: MotA/TolQ/ExbB proton channel family protein [Ignavibacterium sp.]|nr:MAG: MotA/TolQ/ExbB proton channel family protein [Ignavibacterium sp.]